MAARKRQGCDDCAYACREGCAFIRVDEQPRFQAFRLHHRIVGDDWRGWEFMLWIQAQWRAFREPRGISQDHQLQHQDEFDAWLFARVHHPEAA